MKRKIIIDAENVGYWSVEDITENHEDLNAEKGEEFAETYFRAGTFSMEEVEKSNGNHFLYGFMESLHQRDDCPTFLYDNSNNIVSITVETVKEQPKTVPCERCRFCKMKMGFESEGDRQVPSPFYVCIKDQHDLTQVDNIQTVEVSCSEFKSKYIEYPLVLQKINYPKGSGIQETLGYQTGSLVRVRPCGEEYGNQTYLGFLLGDADLGIHASYQENTQELTLYRHMNPAIFVPALGKVIYGAGSYWSVIQSEEQLKDITDSDIDNVWYVKALKQMSGNHPSDTEE